VWVKEPHDGFRSLVRTRRVLDIYGFCCDYSRCGKYRYNVDRVYDRCMKPLEHVDSCHGEKCGPWCSHDRHTSFVLEDEAVYGKTLQDLIVRGLRGQANLYRSKT
jgi:hypothetical protein